MIVRLLGAAAMVRPPFALLEDGAGGGILLWGEERKTLPWQANAVGSLEGFDGGKEWCGALAYDLGLPPNARRAAPPAIEQPLADLFRPEHRIVIRGDGRVECRGRGRDLWHASGAAPAGSPAARPRDAAAHEPRRSFTQADFAAAVARTLEYIRAGDIYQANLSVAESVCVREPPLAVYRRLRAINPSPWMGYADFGDWQLVCGSPELLVEVRGEHARARPIAGTRKKTGNAATDAAMRAELAADPKERAEHVMLVDLARNDLGRVARFGSVAVREFGAIEEYSHVMHLVSDVTARLGPSVRPFDVFRALFPGGTITGAPKIRAMEIIAELEPAARGMYTGALGWWSGGAGQWNIVIRSAVVRGDRAVIQAGAGIVADSDPAREWRESLRKAAALRAAFGIAP